MNPPLGYISPEEVLNRHASLGADIRDRLHGNADARGDCVLSGEEAPGSSLRPPAHDEPPPGASGSPTGAARPQAATDPALQSDLSTMAGRVAYGYTLGMLALAGRAPESQKGDAT